MTRRTKVKEAELKHYLISFDARSCWVHAYVMVTEKDSMDHGASRLLHESEAIGLKPNLGIMLMTDLGDKVDVVRDFVRGISEEAAQALKTATDYYLTAWMMPPDNPDHAMLMALH